MGFDIWIWYSSHPVSDEDAHRTYESLTLGDPGDVEESPSLAAFVRDVRRQWPWLREPSAGPVSPDGFEFDSNDWHGWFGIPWTAVARVGPSIQRLVEKHGLVLFDPQDGCVHLPEQLGGSAPIDWAALARPGLELIESVASDFEQLQPSGDDRADALAFMRKLIEEHGVTFSSPTSVDVGRENLERLPELFRIPDVPFVEPFPVPLDAQTPKAFDARRRELASTSAVKRRVALSQLGGWAPTEDVRAQVRESLEDPDVYVRGSAVHLLGHFGEETSFERMLQITEQIASSDPVRENGIDITADAAADAVHGLLLLKSAHQRDYWHRLRAIVPRLRTTGASFRAQLNWMWARLEE
jgi:HEAT repeat protein